MNNIYYKKQMQPNLLDNDINRRKALLIICNCYNFLHARSIINSDLVVDYKEFILHFEKCNSDKCTNELCNFLLPYYIHKIYCKDYFCSFCSCLNNHIRIFLVERYKHR